MLNSAALNSRALNEGASRAKVVLASAVLAVGSSAAGLGYDQPIASNYPYLETVYHDGGTEGEAASWVEFAGEGDGFSKAVLDPPWPYDLAFTEGEASAVAEVQNVLFDRAGFVDAVGGTTLLAEAGTGPYVEASTFGAKASLASFEAAIQVDRAGRADVDTAVDVYARSWVHWDGRVETGYVAAYSEPPWPYDVGFAYADSAANLDGRAVADRAGTADGPAGTVLEAYGESHGAFVFADVSGASVEANGLRTAFGEAWIDGGVDGEAYLQPVVFSEAEGIAGFDLDLDPHLYRGGLRPFDGCTWLFATANVNGEHLARPEAHAAASGHAQATHYHGSFVDGVGRSEWEFDALPLRTTGVRTGYIDATGEAIWWAYRYVDVRPADARSESYAFLNARRYMDQTIGDAAADIEVLSGYLYAGRVRIVARGTAYAELTRIRLPEISFDGRTEAYVDGFHEKLQTYAYTIAFDAGTEWDVADVRHNIAYRHVPFDGQTTWEAPAILNKAAQPLAFDAGTEWGVADVRHNIAYRHVPFDAGTEWDVADVRHNIAYRHVPFDSRTEAYVDGSHKKLQTYAYTIAFDAGTEGYALVTNKMSIDLEVDIDTTAYARLSINLHEPAPDERYMELRSEEREMTVPSENRVMEA